MKRQIVITEYNGQRLTALYENDVLMEICLEPTADLPKVGDIYIGKVKNIVPNIEAAFVEITPGVMGYYSLRENPRHLFANPKSNEKIVAGDEIVVQISKENLKTKVCTLTGRLSLPGRLIALNIRQTDIRISSKIKNAKERERLKAMVDAFPSECKGWTIRTDAFGVSSELLADEMQSLEVNHNNIMSTYQKRTCFSRLYESDTACLQIVRRYLSDDDCIITTDQENIYQQLERQYHPSGLKWYSDKAYSLIKLKGIEAQIEKALQKKAWLKSGGYLVIEPTEALTVIDVNTGKAIGKQKLEENFFKINMEAAGEVCRQMRLRNLSGIIIVDFINMQEEEHLHQLVHFLREETAKDPVQTTVVDRTALHLIEITRKKVRKSLAEQVKQNVRNS